MVKILRVGLSGLLLTFAGFVLADSLPPLKDAPVIWFADDDKAIAVPEYFEPGLMPYTTNSYVSRPFARFFHPGRLIRKIDSGYAGRRACNVNSLGEVVNSSWFTNRIGLYPMSVAEVARGSGQIEGPDRSSPWEIIGAKTSGVTPGFRIRDGRGDVWLLKFDPPEHPGLTIRSGVVTNLIFYAIGYNVPVDRVVEFDLEDLIVGEGAVMKLPRVGEVPMTKANLDSVLQSTGSIFNGHFQALASKYLSGKPLGPFNDQGLREDDPNDIINHEDRRELRALKVFSSWVNHFDTKMHNSLDMYVGTPGQGYVKHHLIDFASTLGAFGGEPVQRYGYETGFDVGPITGRFLALGLHEDPWVNVHRPEGLSEVGLFVADPFEPEKWKPDIPHSGMAEMTAEDGYWGAKIISAFSREQIKAMVLSGKYQDPMAVDYLADILCQRRDKIVRYWFSEVPPLDFFQSLDGVVKYSDLGAERGYFSEEVTQYRYRMCAVNSNREGESWSQWQESDLTVIPLQKAPESNAQSPFLALECQVNRGQGWSDSVMAYLVAQSGRLVAVHR